MPWIGGWGGFWVDGWLGELEESPIPPPIPPEPEVVFVSGGHPARHIPWRSWLAEFIHNLNILKKPEEVILPTGEIIESVSTGIDEEWILQNLEDEYVLGLIDRQEYNALVREISMIK